MIISAELPSTGSPPARASVTGTADFLIASDMRAAGRV
ncbi:hypothetical protein I543_2730 [Mycobacteroides abscessus 21]|uniref:Uncharacterized protein n=1 Tax=Mycobacteroides abscessus 21 TaxID=1299324 RepID=A0A829Q261_9MYCO|nr:hypothetical protein I543_2730 [Mycobacteroides abscessus 21]